MKTSFSRFTNTADNPILLDEDDTMESKNVKHEDENIPELKPLQDPTTKDTPKIHGLNFAYCSTGLKEANNEPAHRRGRKRKDTDDVRTKGNLSGVETMLQELTMKDETAADGLKTGKEKEIQRKGKEVDNTDKGTKPSSTKDKLMNDAIKTVKRTPIEVGSSSRVTRSKSHSVIVLDTPDRNKKDSNMMDGQSTAGSRKSLRLRSVPHEQKTQEREEQNARMDFDSPGYRKPRLNVIRTRTSPRTLYDTIDSLNPEQEKTVQKMGLYSLLKMSLDGVPSKMGFFVVDRLDTSKMCLRVNNGDIPITVESIHDILRLPTGGIDLLKEYDVDSEDKITRLWKKQFKKTRMRPTDVMNLILQTDDAGFRFKLNFLVLFVNLMGECNSMGTCSLTFLSKIKSEDMIAQIDWCKFIYDKIKTSKRSWNRDNGLCFYSGPLTYLTLLYVDSTISKRVEVDQNTPALWVWNIGLLKKRESTEIKRGGFGLLPLKNKVVRDGKIGISSTFGDKEDCQTTNEWATKEEYVTSIKEKLNRITKLRKEAENELAVAMSKFGCNEEFTSVKAEIDMMFGNQKLTAVSTPMNTPLKPVKQDVPSPCTAIVLSQNIVDPFDKLWESPTYVVEVTESLRVSVENSKIKKSLADIAPQELRFGKSASREAMNSDKRNGKGKLIDSKLCSAVFLFSETAGSVEKIWGNSGN